MDGCLKNLYLLSDDHSNHVETIYILYNSRIDGKSSKCDGKFVELYCTKLYVCHSIYFSHGHYKLHEQNIITFLPKNIEAFWPKQTLMSKNVSTV